MLLILVTLQTILVLTLGENRTWTVSLDQGEVKGYKYWGGEYYEFYGIPYASIPLGRDRYKGPLPPRSWEGILDANEEHKHIMCPQLIHIDAEPIEEMVIGQEDCLVINLFVPMTAEEEGTRQKPVMVYIHGGAYSLGYGNMVSYQNLLKHDVIVVSFNYRIGALGFLCLGTEEVPGNAGMKDQVEALNWIQKNIGKFNGDPNDVTIAGYTVGASSAELLMMSKAADGLFVKVIADSGSALSPWAVDLDPVSTAKNIAASMGFVNVDDLSELTEFYLKTPAKILAAKSVHLWNPNSTFAFAPCVERKLENVDSFLTESPLKIFEEGNFRKLPVLTGFSNMEGISRLGFFNSWSYRMNYNLIDFLPADIEIDKKEDQNEINNIIKEKYFFNEPISDENPLGFINYFSDAMFLNSIMRSARYHSKFSDVYLYEFSYVGSLSTEHQFMDIIKGASHRDQTAYILNFGLGYISKPRDLKTRERLTTMWTNFVKYGKPIPNPSKLLSTEWPAYTTVKPDYLAISDKLEVRSQPLEDRVGLWDRLYAQFYRAPAVAFFTKTRAKTEL